MTYKAVSTSVSHIAHAGLGYTVDRQKKHHSKANGWYIPKSDTVSEEIDGVKLGGYNESHDSSRSTYTRNRDMGSGSASTGGSGSTNNTNDTSGHVWPDAETVKNSKYYEGQDPSKMTDDQLRDYRNRKVMEDYYNKNNPSRSEEFMKGAQQANQLVSQGAAFTKSLMPDKIYAAPLDLSNMTDEQLRAANNRAQLEMQYNQYFNPPKQNEAKKWVDVAATGMGLAISAAGVAVPIVIEIMRNKKKGG